MRRMASDASPALKQALEALEVGAEEILDDAQQLAALHGGQRLFGFENRQRAIQATGVEFLVNVHIGSI